MRVVLEASTRTRWAAEVLEGLGAEVVVVDPRKVRVIAETKHKTDRTDARILADLLRTVALPKALWRGPKATRQLRDKIRLRWGLIRQGAGLYLRARSMLSSIGISPGKRALAGEATWSRMLKRKDVPPDMKRLLTPQCAPSLAKPIWRPDADASRTAPWMRVSVLEAMH